MTQKLANKIALITGGSEGIGYATAELFVREGAFVYITGRRQDKLDEAVNKLGNTSVACGIQADASNIKDFDKIHDQILKEKGQLDILFANAGYIELGTFGSTTEAAFDKLFNTNVKGVFFLGQKLLPLFKNGGSIVLNASVTTIMGPPEEGVYSATKAAVRSFARSWSTDLKGRNIRVNAVSPGAIETPLLRSLFQDDEEQKKEFIARLENDTVLGRVGRADEVAKAVLFLASDDSSYCTGIELFVDGGTGQV